MGIRKLFTICRNTYSILHRLVDGGLHPLTYRKFRKNDENKKVIHWQFRLNFSMPADYFISVTMCGICHCDIFIFCVSQFFGAGIFVMWACFKCQSLYGKSDVVSYQNVTYCLILDTMFFGSVRTFEKRSVLNPVVYPGASTHLNPYCDVWLNIFY